MNNIGDKVYWNDPDNGICSGIYTIKDIERDKVYVLTDGKGSVVEATLDELEDPINALLKQIDELTEYANELAKSALAYGEAVDNEMGSGDYHLDDISATAEEIETHNKNVEETTKAWNKLESLINSH